MDVSMVRSLNLVLTLENDLLGAYFIFCNYFQNLRLGGINFVHTRVASDHTRRIASDHVCTASVCNPTDLFCTNKNSIGPYAPPRFGPYAPHRIASDHICTASVCNQTDLFCTNKQEPHRTICTTSDHICTASHRFGFVIQLIFFVQTGTASDRTICTTSARVTCTASHPVWRPNNLWSTNEDFAAKNKR